MALTEYAAAPAEAELHPQNFAGSTGSLAIFGAEQFAHNAAVHEHLGSGVTVPDPDTLDSVLGGRTLSSLADRKAHGAEDQLFISPVIGEGGLTLGALVEMYRRRGGSVYDPSRILEQYPASVHNNHAPEDARARALILLRDDGSDEPVFANDTAMRQWLKHRDAGPELSEGAALAIPSLTDVLVADLVRREAGQPLLGEGGSRPYRLSAYPRRQNLLLPATEVNGDRRRAISAVVHIEMGKAGLYRTIEAPLF